MLKERDIQLEENVIVGMKRIEIFQYLSLVGLIDFRFLIRFVKGFRG